jgi:nicotinamidase-related amidase
MGGFIHSLDSAMNTALLLIDVQQSFTRRPYWNMAGLPAFLQATNALVAGCVARAVPLVRVLHVNAPESGPDDPFAAASPLLRPLDGLVDFAAAHTVHKHRHSALVGTGLAEWLRAHGITRVIVAGIRTEQCCETTTRHASDEGFEVDFATEATLSFDMPLPGGRVLTTAQIRERTAAVLAGRFATITSVEEALARVG